MTGTELKYFHFWAKIFHLKPAHFASGELVSITKGHYVEKYGKQYAFLFEDLKSGKQICAAATRVPAEQLRQNYKLAFDDYDYVLESELDFRRQPLQARVVQIFSGSPAIDEFLGACTEDDRDTLDLSFEDEIVFAHLEGEAVLGVARSVLLKGTGITDVTMLVHPRHRGNGLAGPMMSALIEKNLELGHLPKYRVSHDKIASIAVAKRLGFVARFRLQSYELAASGT